MATAKTLISTTACALLVLAVSACCPQVKPDACPCTQTGTLLLFDDLWDYNDPGATEAEFRELLKQSKETGDLSYRLQLMTQIARAQGLQANLDEAHATLDEVEKELSRAPTVVLVRYLLERGRLHNVAGNDELAYQLLTKAWETAKEANLHYYAVDAAHMMGIIESPAQALIWSEKALAYAEGSRDKQARRWMASLHNNIGWAYFDLGELDRALDMLRKSLAYREERGKPGPILVAKWGVGRVHRARGEFDEALIIQEEVLAAHKAAGTSDPRVYEELGELYWEMERKADARKYFGMAYEAYSQDPWMVENQAKKLKRLKKLAR